MFLDNFFKEKNWQKFTENPKTNIYAGENIWPLIIKGLFDNYKVPFIVITSTFDKNAELMDDFGCFENNKDYLNCLLYTSPSPRDRTRSRMPSSA